MSDSIPTKENGQLNGQQTGVQNAEEDLTSPASVQAMIEAEEQRTYELHYLRTFCAYMLQEMGGSLTLTKEQVLAINGTYQITIDEHQQWMKMDFVTVPEENTQEPE